MSNLIVVLMGGLSGERKISFLTGKACSKALKKKGYKVVDLDAKGYFVDELKQLKPKLVFNALHGKYGEDGFVQVLSKTLFFTCSINFSKSSDLAFPLLTKKLQCFWEIWASPTFIPAQPESLISFQAFLFSGFLKVLPQVLILDGCVNFFFSTKLFIFS